MAKKTPTPAETKPKEAEQRAPEATGQGYPPLNPGGRPKKIATPELFDALVDDYIAKCREKDEPILLLGMRIHLGLYGKEALAEYAGYLGFSSSVRRARAFIEHEYEKRLVTNSSAAGPIFALKNFNWSDQQQLSVTSDSKVEHSGAVGLVGLDFEEVRKRVESLK